MCVCVCVCARASVCVCACACVCVLNFLHYLLEPPTVKSLSYFLKSCLSCCVLYNFMTSLNYVVDSLNVS